MGLLLDLFGCVCLWVRVFMFLLRLWLVVLVWLCFGLLVNRGVLLVYLVWLVLGFSLWLLTCLVCWFV